MHSKLVPQIWGGHVVHMCLLLFPRYEQEFVYQLLLHLKCNEIDPDYIPVHGHGAIITSNQAQPRASKSHNRR